MWPMCVFVNQVKLWSGESTLVFDRVCTELLFSVNLLCSFSFSFVSKRFQWRSRLQSLILEARISYTLRLYSFSGHMKEMDRATLTQTFLHSLLHRLYRMVKNISQVLLSYQCPKIHTDNATQYSRYSRSFQHCVKYVISKVPRVLTLTQPSLGQEKLN